MKLETHTLPSPACGRGGAASLTLPPLTPVGPSLSRNAGEGELDGEGH